MDTLDALKFSVIVTFSVDFDPPCMGVGGDSVFGGEQTAEVNFSAVLSGEKLIELLDELCLSADCSTVGSMGPSGFEAEQLVPAVSFRADDGCGRRGAMAYVTPWTEREKQKALAEIAGESPAEVPVLGEDGVSLCRMIPLPLWGEDWPRVEKTMLEWFADGTGLGALTSMDGDPLSEAKLVRAREDVESCERRLRKSHYNVRLEEERLRVAREQLHTEENGKSVNHEGHGDTEKGERKGSG